MVNPSHNNKQYHHPSPTPPPPFLRMHSMSWENSESISRNLLYSFIHGVGHEKLGKKISDNTKLMLPLSS